MSRGERADMRVLVIEPTPLQASVLEHGFREAGHAVEIATDSAPALDLLLEELPYDVAVLDVAPPVRDGLATVRALRARDVRVPLLLLTGDDVAQRVRGLDLGADDCLTTPFALQELLARVRALLRRRVSRRSPLLRAADLVFDPATHRAWRGDRQIRLTTREFALLEYFLRNAGHVLTRPMILDHVWGLGFETESNVVDVYVGYLRRKIDDREEIALMHTVRGVGYMLAADGHSEVHPDEVTSRRVA
jgi:DNA-binding response OmpR family regulator